MAYSHMEGWWRDDTPDFRDWLRRSAIGWRREPLVKRIPRPTKLVTARRLGYKAKLGIVMVRVRVRRGGARKPRPTSGRRHKAMVSSKFTRSISLQAVAERRVVRRYPNLTVRDTYHLYSDGMSHLYAFIVMYHHHIGLQE